jgi:hypothetical protein
MGMGKDIQHAVQTREMQGMRDPFERWGLNGQVLAFIYWARAHALL